MNAPQPPRKPRRSLAKVALVLLLGLMLGVCLDRVVLHFSGQRSPRSQLVGSWVGVPNNQPLDFKEDGTFARTMPVLGMQGIEGSKPIIGQWRWLDDDSIEMSSFGQREDKARVVIEAGVLKLLRDNGDVSEYRRK